MKTLQDLIERLEYGAVIEKVWNDSIEETEFYVDGVQVADPEARWLLYDVFDDDPRFRTELHNATLTDHQSERLFLA